jgi:hypothetical protein
LGDRIVVVRYEQVSAALYQSTRFVEVVPRGRDELHQRPRRGVDLGDRVIGVRREQVGTVESPSTRSIDRLNLSYAF